MELLLNGKSLGIQDIHADASPRTWKVSYEPGTLKAIASNDGRVVATDELRTAGEPARIVLSTDHKSISPNWEDVSYVSATVVDVNGIAVPTAKNEITFKVMGPASIIGVDNADNTSHESFQGNRRSAYSGRAVAILRSTLPTGRILFTASAPGLAPGSIVLQATSRPRVQ